MKGGGIKKMVGATTAGKKPLKGNRGARNALKKCVRVGTKGKEKRPDAATSSPMGKCACEMSFMQENYNAEMGELQMATIKTTALRVPEHVYNELKNEADKRGISVNELICLVLFDFVHTSSIQIQFPC